MPLHEILWNHSFQKPPVFDLISVMTKLIGWESRAVIIETATRSMITLEEPDRLTTQVE